MTDRKDKIKNITIIFLLVMLILTFFSNTIMNYSLVEVSTQQVTSGQITSKVRGSGSVEASESYSVTIEETRKIAPDTGKRLILQIEWSAVSKIKELNSILTLIAPAITLTPETSGDIHSNIRKLLLDIVDEYQTDSFLSEAVIYSKMLEVLVLIGRHHTASSCHFNVGRHKQQEYLERFLSICEYIDAHCTEDITLDEISKIAGFSKYHFTRLFKQFTNNTFYKYLNQKRIELALTLLADPNISVTETAMQSGFANPSSFIRVFKSEKDCTPTEFRKMFTG